MQRVGVLLLLSVGFLVMRSPAAQITYNIEFTTSFGPAPTNCRPMFGTTQRRKVTTTGRFRSAATATVHQPEVMYSRLLGD